MPAGPFAPAAYEALLDALDSEIKVRKKDARAAGLQRVSLPGFIIAKTRLANHMAVPVVAPDLRAMFRWTADALVKAVKVQVKAMAAGATPPPEEDIDCGRRVGKRLRHWRLAQMRRRGRGLRRGVLWRGVHRKPCLHRLPGRRSRDMFAVLLD